MDWCEPGEIAAMEVLMGSKNGFLTKRLRNYSTDRNNPCKPTALSGLSPYLHFGQISAQRCALEARKLRASYPQVCFTMLFMLLHFVFPKKVVIKDLFLDLTFSVLQCWCKGC